MYSKEKREKYREERKDRQRTEDLDVCVRDWKHPTDEDKSKANLPLVTFMAKRNTVRADHQISPETKHQRRGSGVSAKLRVRVISHRLDFRMMMASVVESCSVQTWKKHEKVLHEGKSTRVEGTGHNTPLVHALFS